MSTPARIVLFGATGYTGRLTVQALVDRGLSPLLAARDAVALTRLTDLFGLDGVCATADGIGCHLRRGDVLVNCAGPFKHTGAAVLAATLDAGAHLVDCSGEPAHLRATVARHADAVAARTSVLPGFGFDYLPGHAAALTALELGGSNAVRVLYALTGDHGASRGTRASLSAGDGYVLAQGEVRDLHETRRVEHLVDGRPCRAGVIGSTETLLLPRVVPGLMDVEVALGKLRGALPLRPVHVPAVERDVPDADLGGPSAERRAHSGCVVAAWAGTAHVVLEGPNGYELTASLLAAAASRVAAAPTATGVRGPLEVFGASGIDVLLHEAGMRTSRSRQATPA